MFRSKDDIKRIEELESTVKILTIKLRKFTHPAPELKKWAAGDRVKGNKDCGFNRGMHGTVVFPEPNGDKVWVQRDGASGPCYFHSYELDPEQ